MSSLTHLPFFTFRFARSAIACSFSLCVSREIKRKQDPQRWRREHDLEGKFADGRTELKCRGNWFASCSESSTTRTYLSEEVGVGLCRASCHRGIEGRQNEFERLKPTVTAERTYIALTRMIEKKRETIIRYTK